MCVCVCVCVCACVCECVCMCVCVDQPCICMYRLYHEVEVSTRFTHRGPEARGCVNHVETDTE